MKTAFLFILFIFITTSALSQIDSKFDHYLQTEREALPVEGELLYAAGSLHGYRYTGESHAVKTIVDADTLLPFALAMNLTVPSEGINSWEPQLLTPVNLIDVKKNDILFYIFYIRMLEAGGVDGLGKSLFYVQKSQPPWTGLGSLSVTIRSDWNKYYVIAKAGEDYPTGGMEATFHLGYKFQIVEIGGIIALNLGQNINTDELPATDIYYEGMEPDAAWRSEAAVRIEKYRKTDITINVKNRSGEPLENAKVHVLMKNHRFCFGTFIGELVLQYSTDALKYKDELLSNFNCATTPFYMGSEGWGWYHSEQIRQNYIDMAGWLQENQIPAKGHVLIWPGWQWMPDSFREFENDAAGLYDAIKTHLETLVPVGTEKGLVEWDVVNEPHTNHDVMDILGDNVLIDWFNKVHILDTNPMLILNEYNILSQGGIQAFQDDLDYYIDLMLSEGAPLGGIGMQCHFDANLTGIPRILEILDHFEMWGLPIQITEFDINIRNEELQAAYTRDFYTAVFSHPATNKIVMWGFWEGDHWKPDAAMIRQDWTYKPNYEAFLDLVFDEWRTNETGFTDEEGCFRTRGFMGSYQISAEYENIKDNKNVSVTPYGVTIDFTLPPASANVDLPVPSMEPALMQNYPNPFNTSTRITYRLSKPDQVTLKILDLKGRLVKVLIDQHQNTGQHIVTWHPSGTSTGLYLYQLKTGTCQKTRKLLLQNQGNSRPIKW